MTKKWHGPVRVVAGGILLAGLGILATQLILMLGKGTISNLTIVNIPAGNFWMGSDSGNYNESPLRQVYLDAYAIDRYEVTNEEYRRFMQATGGKPPAYWQEDNYPTGMGVYPVVGVSWKDADAYCRWAGKRLPTEAEWEKACRGTDARIYPWGDKWNPRLANVNISFTDNSPAGQLGDVKAWALAWQLLKATPADLDSLGLRPVGSYPSGASPYGVMDLAGNASEWVLDWYNWGDYSKLSSDNPLVTGPQWNHCVRGSAWYDPAANASWVESMSRCSARNSSHNTNKDPRMGFRCAAPILVTAP